MKKNLLLSLLVAVGLVGCGGSSDDGKPNPAVEKGVLYFNADFSPSQNLTPFALMLKDHKFTFFNAVDGATNQYVKNSIPLTKSLYLDKEGTNSTYELAKDGELKLVKKSNAEFIHGTEEVGGDDIYVETAGNAAVYYKGQKLDTQWHESKTFGIGDEQIIVSGKVITIPVKGPCPLEQLTENFYRWNVSGADEMYMLFTMYQQNGELYLYRELFDKDGELLQSFKPLEETLI
ncbi:hypothetical protein [Photobacterium sanguinicancri]|uniref:hypothetical protein n=1 Tax=Photobacterium sanguinicancri TaxID=875932 RepID=UPI0026E3D3DE|nr:hypothetical protein [Photobacterium sanguinicancri]MDO6500116.1 hypothetical protein [Photobacterium sanguinicancri]